MLVDCIFSVRANMFFVQVTEDQEHKPPTIEDVTCKVKGLPTSIAESVQSSLTDKRIIYSRGQECLEADTSGVTILNILGALDYRVYGQSMTIQESNIGGRTVLVHRIVWTMGK